MRKEERVESILGAAARAFARAGYAATSMEDIASEAGITKLILYRHFEGKQGLYEAVLARVSERLREEFVQGAASGRVGVGVSALLTVAREDADSFLLLFRHAAREPQFAAYAEGYLARVRAACERLLDPMVDDPLVVRWLSRAIVATVIEAVIAWLETGAIERDEEFLVQSNAVVQAMVAAARGQS